MVSINGWLTDQMDLQAILLTECWQQVLLKLWRVLVSYMSVIVS